MLLKVSPLLRPDQEERNSYLLKFLRSFAAMTYLLIKYLNCKQLPNLKLPAVQKPFNGLVLNKLVFLRLPSTMGSLVVREKKLKFKKNTT